MKQAIFFVSYLFFIVMLPFAGNSQEKGIRFESGLSWEEIQAKAKAENKPIFMDCYTTWCGPCKYMEKEIYTLSKVGEYFNEHFINVAVQLDKTGNDAQHIKDWYRDAASIQNKYSVSTFPTYLFFSPDGKALHQFVGASDSGSQFIARAAAALDPERQYFSLLANWGMHKNDSAYLLHALIASKEAGDEEHARMLASDYINCLKEPVIKYNIELIDPYVISETDKGFQIYLQYASRIDQLMGSKNFVEDRFGEIIFKGEVAPLVEKKEGTFDWKKISNNIQHKYPTLDKEEFSKSLNVWFQNAIGQEITVEINNKEVKQEDWAVIAKKLETRFLEYDCKQIILNKQIQYYGNKKIWHECSKAALSMIGQYGKQLGDGAINDICYSIIFLHANDKSVLTQALRYMERVVQMTPEDCDDLDTYANLLYKTGHKQEAMDWENKAISMAEKFNRDLSTYKEALEKMKKGEPTWQEG